MFSFNSYQNLTDEPPALLNEARETLYEAPEKEPSYNDASGKFHEHMVLHHFSGQEDSEHLKRAQHYGKIMRKHVTAFHEKKGVPLRTAQRRAAEHIEGVHARAKHAHETIKETLHKEYGPDWHVDHVHHTGSAGINDIPELKGASQSGQQHEKSDIVVRLKAKKNGSHKGRLHNKGDVAHAGVSLKAYASKGDTTGSNTGPDAAGAEGAEAIRRHWRDIKHELHPDLNHRSPAVRRAKVEELRKTKPKEWSAVKKKLGARVGREISDRWKTMKSEHKRNWLVKYAGFGGGPLTKKPGSRNSSWQIGTSGPSGTKVEDISHKTKWKSEATERPHSEKHQDVDNIHIERSGHDVNGAHIVHTHPKTKKKTTLARIVAKPKGTDPGLSTTKKGKTTNGNITVLVTHVGSATTPAHVKN